MLAKFRACYPTGCLFSELVTIYNGKFVVRVLAQVDGVTRAAGMAAADKIEDAEDQARARALGLLNLDNPPLVTSHEVAPQPHPSVAKSQEKAKKTGPIEPVAPLKEIDSRAKEVPSTSISAMEPLPLVPREYESDKTPTLPLISTEEESVKTTASPENSSSNLTSDDWLNSDYSSLTHEVSAEVDESLTPEIEEEIEEIILPTKHQNNGNNSTEDLPLSLSLELPIWADLPTPPSGGEPQDFSDLMMEIQILQERGNFPLKQQSECLEQLYGKSKNSLDLLDEEELKDFCEYLELFARSTEEIKRLGWNNKKGQTYLRETYNVSGRAYLTSEQLQEFLNYLESQ